MVQVLASDEGILLVDVRGEPAIRKCRQLRRKSFVLDYLEKLLILQTIRREFVWYHCLKAERTLTPPKENDPFNYHSVTT